MLGRETRQLAVETRMLQEGEARVDAGPNGYAWKALCSLRRQIEKLTAHAAPSLKLRPGDLEVLSARLEEGELAPELLVFAAKASALPTLFDREDIERDLQILSTDAAGVAALAERVGRQLEGLMERAKRIGFPLGVESVEELQEKWVHARGVWNDPYETHERLLELPVSGLERRLTRVESLGISTEEALEYIDQVRRETRPPAADRELLTQAQALVSDARLAARRGEVHDSRLLLERGVVELARLRPFPSDGERFRRFRALEQQVFGEGEADGVPPFTPVRPEAQDFRGLERLAERRDPPDRSADREDGA